MAANPLLECSITKALPEYPRVIALYEEAFPPEERIPFDELESMAEQDVVEFVAYFDENTGADRMAEDRCGEAAIDDAPRPIRDRNRTRALCGFSFSIAMKEYVYLLFLAVDTSARSKGYGSRILAQIRAHHPGETIVLDIEPLDTDAPNLGQRERRLAFYLRNGFSPTGYDLYEDDMRYSVLASAGEGGGRFDARSFEVAVAETLGGVLPTRLEAADNTDNRLTESER